MTDWLVSCIYGWMDGWSVYWMAGLLIGWLDGCLPGWSVGRTLLFQLLRLQAAAYSSICPCLSTSQIKGTGEGK